MFKIKKKVVTARKKTKISTKFLSLGLSTSLMLTMVPNNGTFAAEPDKFVTSAYPNHWGRSDLRAYLNNVEKVDKTLPINSTEHGTNAANNPAKFSDAEYALVQPFTYSTNVIDGNNDSTSTYETTDKFWLPSGNFTNNLITSWAEDDIRSNNQYLLTTTNNKQRIIPQSYWSSDYSWLRSSGFNANYESLITFRGDIVFDTDIENTYGAGVAFKMDLSSVIFASAASAASIIANGGTKKIEIWGSSDFGKKTSNSLPDYGIYLKTSSVNSFSPNTLTLGGNNLILNYSGGVTGQYVVVHAFTEDSLENGTTSYAAAVQLTETGNSKSISLDVSDWNLTYLDGYTIKVWMEDASTGSSLSTATVPETFIGSNGSISKNTSVETKNARVFATTAELQTSWGDLSKLDETAYNNVIAGKGQDGSYGYMSNTIHGINPTNQKIYYGTDSNGEPLQFWIAGRETAANGGTISENGNIMTLYQAKTVDTRQFNGSWSSYTGNSKTITLQLENNQSTSYTGAEVSYPSEKITATLTDSTIDINSLKWQHRLIGTTAWSAGMPILVGNYEIRCYAEGTENYERTYSSIVKFNTMGTPSSADFNFTAPSNLFYDGTAKNAVVTGKEGFGTITIKYYKDDGETPAVGNDATTAPTNAGTYIVKIDVADGDSYYSATGLTDENWNFTISKANAIYNKPNLATANTYYGSTLGQVYSATKLKEALGYPTSNGKVIPGSWSWADEEDYSTGEIGQKNFEAQFTPEAGIINNYDLSGITGWDSEYEVISVEVPVTVSKLPMSIGSISFNKTEFIYNGKEQKPEITILNSYNNTPLTYGIDYDIIWPSDITNVGDKQIKIIFKGNYSGEIQTQYTITSQTTTEEPSIEHKDWGTEVTLNINDKVLKQYVNNEGMTSVEISPENTDSNGTVWLKEESGGFTAWYGLNNSSGIFENGSRFYVQWLNEKEHPEAFKDIDITIRDNVENNNSWLFDIGVTASDGTPYKQLEQTVDFYVQIGDDWDKEDLEAYYIAQNDDESVSVRYDSTTYPEGTDEFGIMTLSHFSPYFIYDKLTDEEKAQLNEIIESTNNSNNVSTGDQVTYFTVSALGFIMTLALGLMFKSIFVKKKTR